MEGRLAAPARTASGKSSSIAGLNANQGVADLAVAIRKQLDAMERGAVQRSLVVEFERYGRVISRWPSVPPTPAQRSAMMGQFLTLNERAQAHAVRAAGHGRVCTIKPPPMGATPKTTTKMPRVSQAS